MKNMGQLDRGLRLVAGAALLILVLGFGLAGAGWLYWVAIAVGLVLVVTAVVGTCPAYLPFGIRTCRTS